MNAKESIFSLDALIDAEIARKKGKTPREPQLAALSDQELQAEIQKAWDWANADLSDDEKVGLLDQIRKERDESQRESNSKKWIATDIDIQGEISFQSHQIWIFIGLIGVATISLLLAKEFLASLLPAAIIIFLLLYRNIPISRLKIDANRHIFLGQGADYLPLDFSNFPHARLYVSRPKSRRSGIQIPSLLVASKKPLTSIGSWLYARIFPKTTKERIVILCSAWQDQQGHMIAPWALVDLFRTAYKKAGFTIQDQGAEFTATNTS